MYRTKFSEEYGELVLCYDSKHYWRRDYFPNYKRNRKKTRDSSNLNWDAIFECLNTIKAELKEFFPYKFIEVYGAEADDIIAVLCGELEYENGKTLILSGDMYESVPQNVLACAKESSSSRTIPKSLTLTSPQ